MARNIASKKTPKRASRAAAKTFNTEAQVEQFDAHQPKRDTSPIEPKTEGQRRYLSAMKSFILTFATGPAGTGKTWLASAYAAQLLDAGEITKIVITRPAVEAGESLGFLPGELDEKFDPYLQPFRDAFNERLGKSFTDYLIKRGVIEAAPLAYMRGRTFKDAFVILDEAQNTTPSQMKMFLTRIGHNARVIVNGDTTQHDLRGESGLADAVRRLSFIPSVKHVRLGVDDIVRSGLVQEVVTAYMEAPPEHGPQL